MLTYFRLISEEKEDFVIAWDVAVAQNGYAGGLSGLQSAIRKANVPGRLHAQDVWCLQFGSVSELR